MRGWSGWRPAISGEGRDTDEGEACTVEGEACAVRGEAWVDDDGSSWEPCGANAGTRDDASGGAKCPPAGGGTGPAALAGVGD